MTELTKRFEHLIFGNSCLFPKRALRFAACRVSDFDIRISNDMGPLLRRCASQVNSG